MEPVNIPKVIYMTYKNTPPAHVFKRWQDLNPDYTIEFSMDIDCIIFLYENFGRDVADMFLNIKEGMYKADLWRLCKLYVNGGIYADIDLIPYVSIDEITKNNYTFCSCLDIFRCGIFQAFIITTPKNPLILCFILSLIKNKPFDITTGPVKDMFYCIESNINSDVVQDNEYNIDTVKIQVNIGDSYDHIKKIPLYNFPDTYEYEIKLDESEHNDTFDFCIRSNYLYIKRTDTNHGWGYNHSATIYIKSKQRIYLFNEEHDGNWIESYVMWNNRKILDSRDLEYFYKKEANIPYT